MRNVLLALLLLSLPAAAQPEALFNSGEPPVFREDLLDKRFLQSRVYKALQQGTDDPSCAQLLGAMLTLVGETAPLIHRRDENFYLDPLLVRALNTQMSTPRFQASQYLVTMMRRVFLDKKLPEPWLETADHLAQYYQALDMAKLRFLAEGVQPIDSFLLTLPVLRQRYAEEVENANATAASTAEALFRDTYLDHQVAFGGLEFVDVKLVKPPKKRKKRRGESPEVEEPYLLARLAMPLPDPEETKYSFESPFTRGKRKRPSVQVQARLREKQYVDLHRIPKGTRLLVRGRLWDVKKSVTEVELRDALLFQDRDWSKGLALANPQVIAACPLAVNELTGIAPSQPGAFGQQR